MIGEQARDGAAEAMAGQAVPLLGIWGEMGCHGSPHSMLGQQWLLPSWGSPLQNNDPKTNKRQ